MTKRTIHMSSLSGVIQFLSNTVLIIVTVPLFIDKLGIEIYGAFSLISIIGSLNPIINFGLNTSLIKYLAEQGKTPESNLDIIVVLALFLTILGIVVVVLLFAETFVLSTVLQLKSELVTEQMRALFKFIVLSSAMLIVVQVPSAVLDSQQKVYISNLFQLYYNIISKGLLVICLLFAPTLWYIGLSMLISSLMYTVALTAASVKIWNYHEFFSVRKNFKRVVEKHLHYGAAIYAAGILGFLYEPVTKIIISGMLGIREVAFFDIALRLKNLIWSFADRLLYPFLPHIAAISDSKRICNLIDDLERKILIIVVPMSVTVIFTIFPVIQLWVGQEVNMVASGSVILITAYFFALCVVPTYQFLSIKGHQKKIVLLQGVNLIINVALLMLLIPTLGYLGVILAFSIAVLGSFVVTILYKQHYLNSVFFRSFHEARYVLLLFISLFALDVGITMIKMPSVVHLLLVLTLNFVVSLYLYFKLRLVTSQDIERYFGGIPLLSSLGFKVFRT